MWNGFAHFHLFLCWELLPFTVLERNPRWRDLLFWHSLLPPCCGPPMPRRPALTPALSSAPTSKSTAMVSQAAQRMCIQGRGERGGETERRKVHSATSQTEHCGGIEIRSLRVSPRHRCANGLTRAPLCPQTSRFSRCEHAGGRLERRAVLRRVRE